MKKRSIIVTCGILLLVTVFAALRKKKFKGEKIDVESNDKRTTAEQYLLDLNENSYQLQKEVEKVELISKTLQDIPKDNVEEMDKALTGLMEDLGIKPPWGDRDFDEFMSDPNSVLDFSNDSDN